MGLISFVRVGIEDDQRKFDQLGIEPLSSEAIPYYARWIREDLIGIFYMISRMNLLTTILLVLIAIPLWVLALR